MASNNEHGQSTQLPPRPLQPQAQRAYITTYAHGRRRAAATTSAVQDPRLEHLLVEDGWSLVASTSGPGTEIESTTESNTTTTASASASASSSTATGIDRNNLHDHHHNGRRLTTSNLALLDMNNPNDQHVSRRSGRAHCESLMALGVAARGSSVGSVDHVLPGESWATANAFSYDLELSFVGDWANKQRPQ